MGVVLMKYLLVSGASSSPSLFLVTETQRLQVLNRLEEQGRLSDVLQAGTWEHSGLSLSELPPQFRRAKIWVVPAGGAEEFHTKGFAKTVCEAFVAGAKIIDFNSGLLLLEPYVDSSPAGFVLALTMNTRHQDRWVRAYITLKRMFEPTVAFLMLAFLSPIIALTALAIKATSPGPVFYSQTRRRVGGRGFEIIKFRSMRIDAEANGPVWASAKTGDSRLTPIGAFLRASHLDEIPQLWNVVRGELSFVGPRPERPVFCEKLESDVPLFGLRTLIKPGITGWAQIKQGYANSVEDSRRKLEYDLYYIMNHSLLMDLAIIFGTLRTIVTGGTEGRKRARLQVVSEGGSPRRSGLLRFNRKSGTRPRREPAAETTVAVNDPVA